MIKWLFNRLSPEKQKEFIVDSLMTILKSKDNSIDQVTAIQLIEAIAASKGNKVTAFIMKDS